MKTFPVFPSLQLTAVTCNRFNTPFMTAFLKTTCRNQCYRGHKERISCWQPGESRNQRNRLETRARKEKWNSTPLEVSGYQIHKEGAISCPQRKLKATEGVLGGVTEFEGCPLVEKIFAFPECSEPLLEHTGRKLGMGCSAASL